MFMQPQNLQIMSDESFDIICQILMQNPEKRDEFFLNPGETLAEKGIRLDKSILDDLREISQLSIEPGKMEFNEKLVLCSSSGY